MLCHDGQHSRLAIIEGLEGGEEHGVPLQQVGQVVEQLAPPRGIHGAPGAPQPVGQWWDRGGPGVGQGWARGGTA